MMPAMMPAIFFACLALYLLLDLIVYLNPRWGIVTLSQWMDTMGKKYPVVVIGGYFLGSLVLAYHFWIQVGGK